MASLPFRVLELLREGRSISEVVVSINGAVTPQHVQACLEYAIAHYREPVALAARWATKGIRREWACGSVEAA